MVLSQSLSTCRSRAAPSGSLRASRARRRSSNNTRGDFSIGIHGYRITGGKQAEPVAEMNLSGNLMTFFDHLSAVGADPWPYAAIRTPTLVFDGVQVAGL
ncbi:MAG: metallopeptidase TldD-related protein [Byssovorax sp.]